MKKIGLISDTHGWLDPQALIHLRDCDEIWHGGDFGSTTVAEELRSLKPLRGVYGNIDGADLRGDFPENLDFQCEDVRVLMRHIGGSPPKYNPETRTVLDQVKPKLFITGHSHILKVMYDPARECLFINPGAAGRHGWHKVRTLITLVIDGANMRDCNVTELGTRGK